MKTGSEHSGANIPKSWLREFNHDSEKKNLATGTGDASAAKKRLVDIRFIHMVILNDALIAFLSI